jgi:hypothetical protein
MFCHGCIYLKPRAYLLYVGNYLIIHEFELISGIRFIKQWPILRLGCGHVAGVTGLSILFGTGSAHPGFVASESQWIKRVE